MIMDLVEVRLNLTTNELRRILDLYDELRTARSCQKADFGQPEKVTGRPALPPPESVSEKPEPELEKPEPEKPEKKPEPEKPKHAPLPEDSIFEDIELYECDYEPEKEESRIGGDDMEEDSEDSEGPPAVSMEQVEEKEPDDRPPRIRMTSEGRRMMDEFKKEQVLKNPLDVQGRPRRTGDELAACEVVRQHLLRDEYETVAGLIEEEKEKRRNLPSVAKLGEIDNNG
jgi:hypothetical protein